MENLLSTKTDIKEEQSIIYQAKIHWISFVIPIILMVIGAPGVIAVLLSILVTMVSAITVIGLLVSVIFYKGLMIFLTNRSTKIILTEKHLTITTGILGKTIVDIPIEKFEGIVLTQSFLAKQLNYANLTVTTGELAQSLQIAEPMEFRSHIIKLKSK